jgi:hypothetical protein
LNCEEA